MTQNQLQAMPNIKESGFRQIFNEPKSSGGLPKVSECKSEKGPDLTFFQWRNGLFKTPGIIFLINCKFQTRMDDFRK